MIQERCSVFRNWEGLHPAAPKTGGRSTVGGWKHAAPSELSTAERSGLLMSGGMKKISPFLKSSRIPFQEPNVEFPSTI